MLFSAYNTKRKYFGCIWKSNRAPNEECQRLPTHIPHTRIFRTKTSKCEWPGTFCCEKEEEEESVSEWVSRVSFEAHRKKLNILYNSVHWSNSWRIRNTFNFVKMFVMWQFYARTVFFGLVSASPIAMVNTTVQMISSCRVRVVVEMISFHSIQSVW